MTASDTPTNRTRSLLVAIGLGGWLLLITLFQRPLQAGAGGGSPGPELLPPTVTLAAMALAVVLRVLRPSLATHLACLAVVVGGVALLAASLGTPFANATETYCGDLCRTEIFLRLLGWFGWPPIVALGLGVATRLERRRGNGADNEAATERAAWTRAWIWPVLIVGWAASIAWWRIVLP